MTGPQGGVKVKTRRVNPADLAQLAESPVSMRRVLNLFRPHWLRLVILTFIIVVSSVVGIVQPFLLRGVIDKALPEGDTELLVWLVAGMVGVAAVTSVLGVVQTWMATKMGQTVMHALRVSVFDHIQRQSLAFFKRTRGGEIQSRLLQDIAGIQGVVTSTATSVASNLTTTVATGAAMVVLERLSHRCCVVPSRRVAHPAGGTGRRDLTGQRQRLMADLHSQADEALSVNGAVLTTTLGARSRRRPSTRRPRDWSTSISAVSSPGGGAWRPCRWCSQPCRPHCIWRRGSRKRWERSPSARSSRSPHCRRRCSGPSWGCSTPGRSGSRRWRY